MNTRLNNVRIRFCGGRNRRRGNHHPPVRPAARTVISSSAVTRAAWLLLIGLAVVTMPLVAAESAPLDALNAADAAAAAEGLRHLNAARVALWSADGVPSAQSAVLDRAAAAFDRVGDAAARPYLQARVELYRGRIAVGMDDKNGSRVLFENAMALADSSLAVRETSEAWRVKADAGSAWMFTKGLSGIIRMAPQVQEWSDRAVELDGRNALAILISAQGQINAPKGAGGDPPKAAERLEALNARNDLDEIERFWTQVSLAQVYDKLKRRDEADLWCSRAARIYPNSPLLEECR